MTENLEECQVIREAYHEQNPDFKMPVKHEAWEKEFEEAHGFSLRAPPMEFDAEQLCDMKRYFDSMKKDPEAQESREKAKIALELKPSSAQSKIEAKAKEEYLPRRMREERMLRVKQHKSLRDEPRKRKSLHELHELSVHDAQEADSHHRVRMGPSKTLTEQKADYESRVHDFVLPQVEGTTEWVTPDSTGVKYGVEKKKLAQVADVPNRFSKVELLRSAIGYFTKESDEIRFTEFA